MRIEGSLDNDVPLTVGNHRDESGETVDGRRDFAMENAPRFGQHFQGDIGKVMYWNEGESKRYMIIVNNGNPIFSTYAQGNPHDVPRQLSQDRRQNGQLPQGLRGVWLQVLQGEADQNSSGFVQRTTHHLLTCSLFSNLLISTTLV